MSIFKQSYARSKVFSLGKPEAEAEKNSTPSQPPLRELFVDDLGVFDAIQNGKFIITGRKGTGKSAIVSTIETYAQNDENTFCISTKASVFNSNLLFPAQTSLDSQSILYEWIILSQLLTLILETERGSYIPEIKALKKFYKQYKPLFSIEEFLKHPERIKHTININLLLGPFGSSFIREKERKETENQPFYIYIDGLWRVIEKVLNMQIFQNDEFMILFDDLDLAFKLDNDSAKDNLLTLIRIAKRINTNSIFHGRVYVLLFLRDDVRRSLVGHAADSSKIFGSYEFPINWYEGKDTPENQLKLKKLLNKRISKNFSLRNLTYSEDDPWQSYVSTIEYHDIFRRLLDFTFYRPRDIINLFLPLDNNRNLKLPLSPDNLRTLVREFSARLYEEFEDELCMFMSPAERTAIRSLLSNFVLSTKNTNNVMSYHSFASMISKPLDERVVDQLYQYDIIGFCEPNNNRHFHFRDSYPTCPVETCYICVPHIIRIYFDRSTYVKL